MIYIIIISFIVTILSIIINRYKINKSNISLKYNNVKLDNIELDSLPNHVGIIMDGNGRWGKNNGGIRILGHKKGADSLKNIIELCTSKYKIKYLTVFAFSDENWNRDKSEIDYIFSLFGYLLEELNSNDLFKINIIGDFTKLDNETKISIDKIIEKTKNNTEHLNVTICLSYSGQSDILYCCKKIAEDVKSNKLNIEDIDKTMIKNNLMTKDVPEIDLLIRTSGEYRISNFMLWDIAYSEMYFDKTLWPDYSEQNLVDAFVNYKNRNRRFGKI